MKKKKALTNISWILILLLILAVITGLASFLLNRLEWVSSWMLNISSELIGAVITYILFELIIGRAEKKNEDERHKIEAQLQLRTRLLKAHSFEEKQLILDEINALGVMRGANLMYSNLSGLFMSGLDMQGVDLSWSDLSGANLSNTNLEGANLTNTNLRGAILIGANFKSAVLAGADLQNATIVGANLDFAILRQAKFQFSNLEKSSFLGSITDEAVANEHTLMPDGQHFVVPGDWSRYTHANRNNNQKQTN